MRFPFAIPWAVLLAGAGYVVARVHHSVADGWAAVVGAALLLAAELAAWSIASDGRIHEERAVVLRQSVTVAALVVAAALVSFVLVGAAAVSAAAGLLLTGDRRRRGGRRGRRHPSAREIGEAPPAVPPTGPENARSP